MMWPGRDEPLFEQRILGERVRYVWRQDGAMHTIRAEWVRGANPWEVTSLEAKDSIRHQAIETVTREMEALIARETEQHSA